MDEMKIKSAFMTNLISKLIRKTILKKIGYDVNIRLKDVGVSLSEEKAKVHFEIDAEMDKNELLKLLKNVGLD